MAAAVGLLSWLTMASLVVKLPDCPNTTPSRNMSSTGKKNVQNSA